MLKKNSKEMPNIPCEEWIRLQFTPSNIWRYRNKNFTMRFDIKMRLQKRLCRKSHPDQKYGCVLFNYFKEYSIKHRDDVCLIFLDDKCSIPIGQPGAPVSVNRRQRSQLVNVNTCATDHDYMPLHFTPSVINMYGKPPRRYHDYFFKG